MATLSCVEWLGRLPARSERSESSAHRHCERSKAIHLTSERKQLRWAS